MGRITLLLVDDHAIVREGLKALFSQHPEYQIVAEAGDGREAIEVLKKRRADIVVLDHSMPGLNGIDAIEEMKRLQPQSRIVVLTGRKEEILVRAAINNGADAYLVKDGTFVELDLAIKVALSGRKYISPSVIDPLIQGYLANPSSGGGDSPYSALTTREREILKLIAEGFTTRRIAKVLFLSQKTVDKHRTNLMHKLDLHSVSALTAYAIRNDLVG